MPCLLLRPGFANLRAMSLLLLIAIAAHAEGNPLIEALQRCGDRLAPVPTTVCIRAAGLAGSSVGVSLNGNPLPANAIRREQDGLRVTLPRQWESGPVWLVQDGKASNAVWLSRRSSYVIPAGPDAVVRNSDDITTYVDLISVLIEEDREGGEESRRLADKYGATVVGAIPPLNLYQLRLDLGERAGSDALVERDALVLRIGSEPTVDAVVIEETAPETMLEGDASDPADDGTQEWSANRFLDAVDFYRKSLADPGANMGTESIRIGIIERDVDFDAPDFADQVGACAERPSRTCVYAIDAAQAADHGTTVTGILAARWDNGGNTGFLRGLEDDSLFGPESGAGNQAGDPAGSPTRTDAGRSNGSRPGDEKRPRFDVIVGRSSDAGITANIAASVNLVEDGVRVLNWSWGLHRIGATDIQGDEVDSLVRSGIAMSGYEELLEEFFLWLRREHPDVIVVNSAGNGSTFSGSDEYRLPSSFITDQLLVVGSHDRTDTSGPVTAPDYVAGRSSSNVDARVDITAAACAHASTARAAERGEIHCGTSYATPLVTAVIAAMLSINPELTPEQVRMLLRRSALPIGSGSHLAETHLADTHLANADFERADAEDLTAPILPSERNDDLHHRDIGYSARLDMRRALELAVESRDRVR